MKILPIILILIFSFSVFGQKSVTDLKPSHAVALEQFLSKNKKYQFLSEKAIDAEYLAQMREWFGKTLKPYYAVGDFNHDKITDFALILSREGTPRKNEDVYSEDLQYDYPLAVVIFNGSKAGTFRQAFIEDIDAPLVCLLSVEGNRKKVLSFGVAESDADTKFFTPVGKGYIIEYPDAP